MRVARLFLTAGMLAIASCSFGRRGEDLLIANQPGGAMALLEVSSGNYNGELIAVQDDGLVFRGRQIAFVPFAAVRTFSVDGMGKDYVLAPGEHPAGEKLAKLRAVSHFPQGLTPGIQKQLLSQAGQTDVVFIR